VDKATKQTANADSWIEARPVKTAQLPVAVAENMSQFFGESVETFDNVVAIRSAAEGDRIAVEGFCHVEGETPHYAKTAEEMYYF